MSEKVKAGTTPEQNMIKKRSQFKEVMLRLSRNKAAMFGLAMLVVMSVVAIAAPVIAPYGPDDQDISRKFIKPCLEHIAGTDNLGRDMLSRLIYGARISLMVGIVATGISAVFGTVIGAVAGYYGGKVDNILMRLMDIMGSMPSMLTAVVICAVLGNGIWKAMFAIGLSGIPRMARTVRAPVMQEKMKEYVEAATAIDAKDSRIIFKHVLPNALSPLIVAVTLGVASAITNAASLSFLGLGVQPPTPEWGALLSAGRTYIIEHSYLITYPGLCIALVVISLNLFGDGLRDAIDPRLKD